jgi:hypothetical protein
MEGLQLCKVLQILKTASFYLGFAKALEMFQLQQLGTE